MKTYITVILTVGILAWNSIAFCDEIYDAAKSGDLVKVKSLVKTDPDLVNSTNGWNNQTPLFAAVTNDRKDVAEFLLSNKADVNAQDKDGKTPLVMAASADHKDMAQLLLDNKADVNAKAHNNNTPLHTAALMGHLDIVKFLLDNKADINAKNKVGWTPLHMALTNNNKDVIDFLRQHGGTE
jgi:ankyrin repeat protein